MLIASGQFDWLLKAHRDAQLWIMISIISEN